MVNTIGAYDGYRPLDFIDGENTTRFQIESGGQWTIEILPFMLALSDHMLEAPGTYEGTGDDVIFLMGETPDIATIKSGPERDNFVIKSYGREGTNLLVNEISPYEGVVIVSRDSRVLVVEASGPWTIEISSP